MPVIDHADCPEIEMRPGIRGRFLANAELGSTGVSLLVNHVDPGAEARRLAKVEFGRTVRWMDDIHVERVLAGQIKDKQTKKALKKLENAYFKQHLEILTTPKND